MNTFWAIQALTRVHVIRLLRDPVTLRSLLFPMLLTCVTMAATIVFVAWNRVPAVLAVGPDVTEAAAEGWKPDGVSIVRSDTPRKMVARGDAAAGTNGETLWISEVSTDALYIQAAWRVDHGQEAISPEPVVDRSERSGALVVVFHLVLYTLFGVIFGAGMIARDRDEGSLAAEMLAPVPWWTLAVGRWLGATIVLACTSVLTIEVFQALMSLHDTASLLQKGIASVAAGAALGQAVIGRRGAASGFAGPLTVGITACGLLLGAGARQAPFAAWLPIASLMHPDSGNQMWFGLVPFVAVCLGLHLWRLRE